MALSEILGLSSAAAKVAGEIAEDAKNKRLVDSGKAAGLAEMTGQVNAELLKFAEISNRMDSDDAFAEFVRAQFKDDG